MDKVEWLKDCDICNAGLCKRMMDLTTSETNGGKGLSTREASRQMAREAEAALGQPLWTAEVIRARYLYNAAKRKSGVIYTKPKQMQTPEERSWEAARREKEKQRQVAAEAKRAKMPVSKLLVAIDQAQYISALERCISDLPKEPPKIREGGTFREAKSLAGILIKRLEAFRAEEDKGGTINE